MFGADTPLVMDALQIAALALAAGAGAVWFVLRRSRRTDRAADTAGETPGTNGTSLSKRVEVLERIATDQSIGLADEIEALRESDVKKLSDKGNA